ncbi:MAG TPA: AGE family epimerase/isomerase [Candidatus Brachybacterium merdigallinarum]|nr:AGE family epimerase/isomerase [Candidatus Brachybacterium merdigallinarum]
MTGSTAAASDASGLPLMDIVREEPARLLAFGQGAICADGGFGWLDDRGGVDPAQPRFLYIAGRIAHTGALGVLQGVDGGERLARHGLRSLRTVFATSSVPGWPDSLSGAEAPGSDARSAYASSFVVLAGASGTIAGIEGAEELLAHSLEVVDSLFWDDEDGAFREDDRPDPSDGPGYRGMNSNMHMVEALLAAHSAGAGEEQLDRATRIARRAVQAAQQNAWRLPEHFDASWNPLLDHNRDHRQDPFRPYGSTIGHWLEWSRLLLHLEAATLASAPQQDTAWMRDASLTLFERAVAEGWEAEGNEGFVYTVDWDGAPVVRRRLHWVLAEAIAAAAVLHTATGDPAYARWRDRWLAFAATHHLDLEHGSWHHELDPENRPSPLIKTGKADLYHSTQAMLWAGITDLPLRGGLAASLAARRDTAPT